jgi:hypothetical protein
MDIERCFLPLDIHFADRIPSPIFGSRSMPEAEG